jgi:hypothetical protein
MVVLYTLLVAILVPVIIWTIVTIFMVLKNKWTWKGICETKSRWAKFMYIWGKIWLYTSAVIAYIWFSYMIAYVIFM